LQASADITSGQAHVPAQASKLNSQLTFEQRKESKQEIERLEKEIIDGNKRIEVLCQVSTSLLMMILS
jgi:hypothetical protein